MNNWGERLKNIFGFEEELLESSPLRINSKEERRREIISRKTRPGEPPNKRKEGAWISRRTI